MKKFEGMTDEALALLYVKGNNSAFDELLSRTQSKLFTYIMFVVHDHDVADDIFQETFVKVITTINQGRYNEYGHFASWIMRIAHNVAVDYFRVNRRAITGICDVHEAEVINRDELRDHNIEESIINTQIHDDVRRLMLQLPDTQREVLILRYYHDMNFKQIAERTRVSINTALGRMRYALINMRRMAEAQHVALSM